MPYILSRMNDGKIFFIILSKLLFETVTPLPFPRTLKTTPHSHLHYTHTHTYAIHTLTPTLYTHAHLHYTHTHTYTIHTLTPTLYMRVHTYTHRLNCRIPLHQAAPRVDNSIPVVRSPSMHDCEYGALTLTYLGLNVHVQSVSQIKLFCEMNFKCKVFLFLVK